MRTHSARDQQIGLAAEQLSNPAGRQATAPCRVLPKLVHDIENAETDTSPPTMHSLSLEDVSMLL